ncbi:low affinity iron permease family protein [Brevundimonas sp.]|uniref:low affinity iron permease family protein n=1 Tax=Brevundimonas sp. TaxID=1871086 RepID=UPI002898F6B8|nr:low affinity iron permease family protein [Brevundimonas sp.]
MEKLFSAFATATARTAGRPWTFMACLLLVIMWGITGPIFRFSETWQLVINTGTTIITFLMVFQVATAVVRKRTLLFQSLRLS